MLHRAEVQWMTRALAALSNENRLLMFEQIREKALECSAADGECDYSDHCCNPGELAASLRITPATVSYHLKELKSADLVDIERRGRFVYCAVNPAAARRLERFFRDSVEAAYADHTP